MAKALYRKYRSKKFGEIVGQEHITTTLENALSSGRISHAYLFTGPRGVGKTSVARILAHEVNGFDYADDTVHLDIIEIDAASNRRIDEIRDLRDKVHIAPTTGKYKVYIIDEVHMLTKEAFNALLKTLEEPPEHVIFILATTEIHKLPETIVSRTQRFTFKPITTEKAVEHLKVLARQENITISDAALELIAEHGQGSFRDSISILDQASSYGESIDANDIELLLGIAPKEAINELIQSIKSGSPKQIVEILRNLSNQGYLASQTSHQICEQLQHALVNGSSPFDRKSTFMLIDQLIQVPASSDPDRALELCLLEITLSQTPEPEQKIEKTPPAEKNNIETKPPKQEASTKADKTPTPAVTKSKNTKSFDNDSWQQVLTEVKKSRNTLYGIVRMAEPQLDGNTIILKFAFPFHQKQMNDAKNRSIVQAILVDVTGNEYEIECILDTTLEPTLSKAPSRPAVPSAPKSDTLDTITNIFGGGEVLESS